MLLYSKTYTYNITKVGKQEMLTRGNERNPAKL